MIVDDPRLALIASWATAEQAQGTEDCPGCGAGLDPTALASGLLDASVWLHARSGWRFPGVTAEESPLVARPCGGRGGAPTFHGAPLVLPGDYPDLYPLWGACGCAGDPCSCCGPEGVGLGRSPIVEVVEVKVDGAAVDPALYDLVGDVLVRLDGQRWPCCQNLALPDTEEGTFAVRFRWGVGPPSLGVRAAIDLGCVLAKAACGDGSCKPVENMVRRTAGGVTVEVQSPAENVVSGTPMSVRLFLDAYNPGDFRSGPVMARPAVRGGCRGG